MSSSAVTRHRLRPNVFGATRLYTLFFNKSQRIRGRLPSFHMAVPARLSPFRQRRIAAHAGMARIVLAIGVVPDGKKIFSGGSLDEMNAALTLENVAGGLNIALTLALMAIGAFKPKWGLTRRAIEN